MSPGPNVTRQGNLTGMGFMFFSTICFAAMHAAISYVGTRPGAEIHAFEIAFFRNVFGVLALAPLLLRVGLGPLKANRLDLLSLRAVINLVAMLAFFYALTLIPLTDVASLAFTAPIFATALAIPLMGERVGWRRALAIAVGFAGVLIIVRPGFATIELGHALVLSSALTWALAMMVIKKASQYDSSLTITLYMGLMMAPLSFPFALSVWTWPDAEGWFYLVLIGVFGGAAQWSLSEALRRGETAVIMPFDFFKLIWAAILGYLFFMQIPGLWTALGGVVIFCAATYIAFREARLKAPQETDKTAE